MDTKCAVLLTVSVTLGLIYGVFRNICSKKHITTNADFYLFNTFSSLFSLVTLIIVTGGIKTMSVFTLLLGIVFGVATALAAIFCMKALMTGPMSYTTLIIYSSMIIPSLSGRLFWNEAVSGGQYAGMALMLLSFALSAGKGGKNSKMGLSWFLLSMGSFVCSGSIGVMQKIHQTSEHENELGMFLVTAFAVAAIFSFISYTLCVRMKNDKTTITFSLRKPIFYMVAGCGISIALINHINLYLSGAMDSAIFFPVVNGGTILLTVLAGIVFFKERLTAKQWAGMAVGITAIGLICLA